jgi:hypothetical protein
VMRHSHSIASAVKQCRRRRRRQVVVVGVVTKYWCTSIGIGGGCTDPLTRVEWLVNRLVTLTESYCRAGKQRQPGQ